MKSPPPARKASSTANEASRSAVQPKTLPPRQKGATSRSLRPMRVMGILLSLAVVVRPAARRLHEEHRQSLAHLVGLAGVPAGDAVDDRHRIISLYASAHVTADGRVAEHVAGIGDRQRDAGIGLDAAILQRAGEREERDRVAL